MEKVDYRAYIRSYAWAQKKADYRASKLPQTCVVCREKKVDLHHRTYARFGRERLTDLVPLCRPHHERVHELVNNQEGPNRKINRWNAIKLVRREWKMAKRRAG